MRVLVATDAAGEGVNLQNANLMVNYDLPWNPNRLEQRFGRIHRIGQTEVCHLWNLVAKETREGDVYHRLLEKLAVESEALKGRVFDILGEVFEETSLKELLIEAIRYGDQPEVRARLTTQIDHALDHDHLKSLLDRNALAQETMSAGPALRGEGRDGEGRGPPPPAVLRPVVLPEGVRRSSAASIHPREAGRFEITHVPAAIRERDRRITGRNRREQEPVLKRYDRICFDQGRRPAARQAGPRPRRAHAPRPPADARRDRHAPRAARQPPRQGAMLVDPADDGIEPWLLFLLTHEVKSGDGSVALQAAAVRPREPRRHRRRSPAGHRTSTSNRSPTADRPLLEGRARRPLDCAPTRSSGRVALAAATLVPEHFRRSRDRRIAHVDKTLAAVHERLTKEIAFWSDRWMKLKEDQEAGKDVRLNLDNARRTVDDLEGRLESRKKELQAMRHVVNGTPVVLGGALVVPAGLLRQLRGETATGARRSPPTPRPAARIERLAMEAVRRAEEAAGAASSMSRPDKCGWDLTSYPPAVDGKQPEPAPHRGQGPREGGRPRSPSRATRSSTPSTRATSSSWPSSSSDEDDAVEGPHYLRNPFDREPGWGVSSINYNLSDLLQRAEAR